MMRGDWKSTTHLMTFTEQSPLTEASTGGDSEKLALPSGAHEVRQEGQQSTDSRRLTLHQVGVLRGKRPTQPSNPFP